MKWFITFLVLFSFIWAMYKDEMPETVQNSAYANVINSILYPIEREVAKFFPNIISYKSDIKTVVITGVQAVEVLKTLQASYNKPAFVFLYDGDTMVAKNILLGVNRILKRYPELTNNFFIAAIGDDSKDFENFLNSFKKVRFVPYYIYKNEKDELYTYFFTKNHQKIGQMPASFFKKKFDDQFSEISADFFAENRIEYLLENNF